MQHIAKLVMLVGILLIIGCSREEKINLENLSFIQSKVQDENIMELYSVKGKFNLNELKSLCASSKKDGYIFSYVVVFDTSENAAFPSQPLSAQYGAEKEKLIHIKAIYVYNSANGYSELTVYDSNAWDGKPTTVKI